LLPTGVLDELELQYVGCEACTRLTTHTVQFQLIQDTSRQ